MNRHRLVPIFLFPSIVAAQSNPPAPRAAPALQEYSVDAGHSIVEFSIGFAFSRIKGRFTHSKGTILYDSAAPANSSITIIIESKSIDTGWPHRDEHLRTSDFFDVDKFPTITFQSEHLQQTANAWIASGSLTMHGITREIAIPFRFLQPPTRSPQSNWMLLNVEGAMRLARADFGILGGSTFNSWFDKARSATMADSVDVSLEIEGWRADAQSQRTPPIEQRLEQIRANGVKTLVDRLQELKKTKTSTEFVAYFSGGEMVTRGLLASSRREDAVTLARTLVELFPQVPRAHVLLGLSLAMSGDTRNAAPEYAKAKEVFRPPVVDSTEKFPQDDENWWYIDQLARTVLEWGYPSLALPIARVGAEMYPGTARAHTTLGLVLASTGDARLAAAAYAKALEVDPRETRALELRRRLQLQ